MDIDTKRNTFKKRWFPVLVLSFAALNVIFLGGKRRAFGIFVAEFHQHDFNTTSLAELNWIGDSYAALGYMSTTVTTAAILRFGRRYRLSQLLGALLVLLACVTSSMVSSPHWLFLTHTVLHGLGSSLILSTVGLIVNEYYDKNHPQHILATTLVSGGSVASIVFVQFYAYLIEAYSWRSAFLVLGALYFLVNTSACLVFARRASKGGSQGGGGARPSLSELCGGIRRSSVPLLLLWTVDRVMTSVVTYGMMLNLADYVMKAEKRLTSSTVLTILFASGEACTYVLGALVTGLTGTLLHGRLRYVLLLSTLGMAASLIAWEFLAASRPLSRLLAFSSGFCLGPSITFLFPAGEEMTGLPGHLAYPFSLFGMGLGMAASPLLTALIAQLFAYKWFFLLQGCLIAVKFCCLALGALLLARNKARALLEPLARGSSPDKKLLLNGDGGGGDDDDEEEEDSQHDHGRRHGEAECDLLTVIRNR